MQSDVNAFLMLCTRNENKELGLITVHHESWYKCAGETYIFDAEGEEESNQHKPKAAPDHDHRYFPIISLYYFYMYIIFCISLQFMYNQPQNGMNS